MNFRLRKQEQSFKVYSEDLNLSLPRDVHTLTQANNDVGKRKKFFPAENL